MSPAFFDDDAAAMRSPRSARASTKRNASGKAVNSPASISSSTRCCLRAAYTSALAPASGTLKWSSAARAPLMRGLPATTLR